MKKIFVSLIAVILGIGCLCCGCESKEDPRQHITMLVYEIRDSGTYLCELTEENPQAEITLEYRPGGYRFEAKAKFPNGWIEELSNKNAIRADSGIYISPNGEVHNDFSGVWERGIYEYSFNMLLDNERAFPFEGYITVHIV